MNTNRKPDRENLSRFRWLINAATIRGILTPSEKHTLDNLARLASRGDSQVSYDRMMLMTGRSRQVCVNAVTRGELHGLITVAKTYIRRTIGGRLRWVRDANRYGIAGSSKSIFQATRPADRITERKQRLMRRQARETVTGIAGLLTSNSKNGRPQPPIRSVAEQLALLGVAQPPWRAR